VYKVLVSGLGCECLASRFHGLLSCATFSAS